jgi:hypothetical protein
MHYRLELADLNRHFDLRPDIQTIASEACCEPPQPPTPATTDPHATRPSPRTARTPGAKSVLAEAVEHCRRFRVPLRQVTLAVHDWQMYPSVIGYDVENLVANPRPRSVTPPAGARRWIRRAGGPAR